VYICPRESRGIGNALSTEIGKNAPECDNQKLRISAVAFFACFRRRRFDSLVEDQGLAAPPASILLGKVRRASLENLSQRREFLAKSLDRLKCSTQMGESIPKSCSGSEGRFGSSVADAADLYRERILEPHFFSSYKFDDSPHDFILTTRSSSGGP
jgi:hypothetical protein